MFNIFKRKHINFGKQAYTRIKKEESKDPFYWEKVPYYLNKEDFAHCPDVLEWILENRWRNWYNRETNERLYDWDMRFNKIVKRD